MRVKFDMIQKEIADTDRCLCVTSVMFSKKNFQQRNVDSFTTCGILRWNVRVSCFSNSFWGFNEFEKQGTEFYHFVSVYFQFHRFPLKNTTNVLELTLKSPPVNAFKHHPRWVNTNIFLCTQPTHSLALGYVACCADKAMLSVCSLGNGMAWHGTHAAACLR